MLALPLLMVLEDLADHLLWAAAERQFPGQDQTPEPLAVLMEVAALVESEETPEPLAAQARQAW